MKFTLYLFAVLSFAGFALVRGVAKGGNCTSGACDTDLFCERNVCKVIAGANCTSDADANCITGATCTSGRKCVCGDTMVPNMNNTKCSKKVGEGCTKNDDCPMHGECKAKKCACMGNYEKSDDGFCKSSGSAVVGTVLMLLVAFVTPRLL